MTPEKRLEELEARLAHVQEQIDVLEEYFNYVRGRKNT